MKHTSVLLVVLLSSAIANKLELIFTQVLYRHGERAPMNSYPNDPYTESIWAYGLKNLVPYGCVQQYELGKYLKERYANLLSSEYKESELYVRSTDQERTLASAYCALAGMYPPTGEHVWNQNLLWQPIPVHMVPLDEDYLLNVRLTCPALERERTSYRARLVEQGQVLYKDLFHYLEQKTGMRNLTSIRSADIYDLWAKLQKYGYMIPDWAYDIWFDPLTGTNLPIIDILNNLQKDNVIKQFDSPAKNRLASGFLVGVLVDMMRVKINPQNKSNIEDVMNRQRQPPTKMVMYSTRSSGMLSLLPALKVFNYEIPPPSSCLLLDLYRDENNDHFVSLQYKNESGEPYPLRPPGCPDDMCPFETFAAYLEPMSFRDVQDRREACI